jgi:nuclear GTP-binding protein
LCNSGKIRYYTIPPEDEHDPHVSSAIVQQMAAEFDISSYEAMETDTLNAGLTQDLVARGTVIQSSGPVEARDQSEEKMEEDTGGAAKGIVSIVTVKLEDICFGKGSS